MRSLVAIGVLLVLMILLAAGVPMPGAETGAVRLEITGNIFLYNGRVLRFMDRIETWTAALGQPSRATGDARNALLFWDALGLQVGGPKTLDGRIYVARVRVWLKEAKEENSGVLIRGFPGTFILEGFTLAHGENYLDAVQRRVPAFAGRGRKMAQDATLWLTRPDGFRVIASAPLHCAASEPADDSCPLVFDGLTFEALWCCSLF